MTGYGRGIASGENFNVSIELKTVNNRFLDINLRCPADLSALESVIKRLIPQRLERGRVDVNLIFERTGQVEYELNRPLIAGYLHALKQMQEEFQLPGEPDINIVARLPGVMQPVRESLTPEMLAGVESALNQALDELEQMRLQEGASLKREIQNHLWEIERCAPLIADVAEDMTDAYRGRLHKRIGDLLARDNQGIELDPARLAQEIAYMADRSDITEEIARLKSHVEQFHKIIESAEPVGKRLDFLLQELNREANTMLSKATNMQIKEAALGIKGEAEKLREQAQNLE